MGSDPNAHPKGAAVKGGTVRGVARYHEVIPFARSVPWECSQVPASRGLLLIACALAACALTACAIVAASASALQAQIPQSEYAARRAALAATMPDGVLIAFGATEPAQDYLSFYQTENFNYLTGLREPDAALVIVK